MSLAVYLLEVLSDLHPSLELTWSEVSEVKWKIKSNLRLIFSFLRFIFISKYVYV